MADLTFNMIAARLSGSVGKVRFDCIAVSGGRGGSLSNEGNLQLQNNPFSIGVKHSAPGTIGGTIPMGMYKLVPHEKRQYWTRIQPLSGTMTRGRSGFAIHGRGSEGSQGCIVPMVAGEAARIRKAVEHFAASEGRYPTLEVIAVGEISNPFNMA